MPVKVVESLIRGLDVLEVFAGHPEGLRLPEVVAKSGLPKASAYRILQTLISRDYLHYFPDTTKYRLAPKVMNLGLATLAGLDIAEVAEPYLRQLSNETDQNVNLGVMDGSEVVYVIRIKRRRILGIDLAVGSRLSAYNTALGQAIMAYLPPEQLEPMLAEFAADPLKQGYVGQSGEKLKQKLIKTREKGYALCDDEFVTGLRSLGAPIFNAEGQVEAALNMPTFSHQCGLDDLMDRYLPKMLEVAQTISRLRGHRADR